MVPLIDAQRCDDIPVIRLHGEFDISTVDALTGALDAYTADTHPGVVIDLTDVTFIDCATIGVLVTAATHARARDGCLVVACPDPKIAHVLTLTTYSATWPVCATTDAALDTVRLALLDPGWLDSGRARAAARSGRVMRRAPWIARQIGRAH